MNKVEFDCEVESIMKRIDDYEQKQSQKKWMKSMTLVASIILLIGVSFSLNEESYGITKISAHEYKLDVFGDEIYFDIYGVIENDKQLALTDDVYVYEDNMKYLDVTPHLEVDLIEIEGYLFLTLKQPNDKLHYFLINNHSDTTKGIAFIDREFTHFESEMASIIRLTKQYPIDTVEEEVCVRKIKATDLKGLSTEDLADYEWFLSLMNEVSCTNGLIKSMTYQAQFDQLGNLIPDKSYMNTNSNQVPYSYPIKIENRQQIHSHTTLIKEVSLLSGNMVVSYFEGHENPEGIIGLDIEFLTENSEAYEIELFVNQKQVPLIYESRTDGHLYLISDFLDDVYRVELEDNQLNQIFDSKIEVVIKEKTSGLEISRLEDNVTFNRILN